MNGQNDIQTKKTPPNKLPPVWLSFIPLLSLMFLTGYVVYTFGADALSGASQIALLLASAVCVGLGLICKHITWDDFEKAVSEKVSSVTQAIIILLLIGALGGSWMVSGIVPSLIYYGLKIMTPEYFLPACCLICAAVSLITGSSWTTVATIGIAVLGIGKALGFSDSWIAGAIISGAYFGDKISPLSDTTILASSSAGTPLFEHIRYMLYTTIPTFSVAILIYAVYGFYFDQGAVDNSTVFSAKLAKTFNLEPWLLLIPLLTGIMIAKKMPSIVILFLAAVAACAAAIIAQPDLLEQISGMKEGGFASRLKGATILLYGSTSLDTGVPELNNLVATRGMSGMMSTIWLILCAMVFGGAMSATGMLESIVDMFARLAKTTVSTVASTACAGVFLNTICGDQYLSIILTGNLFKNIYERNGYEARLLSRTTEDSATVTSALIPWNTCGMTQSTVLGVSVFAYLPYAFFNYLSPVVTVIVAATGYKIYKKAAAALSSAPYPEAENGAKDAGLQAE